MTTTARTRLPHRRPVVTEKIDAFGKALFISAGLDPATPGPPLRIGRCGRRRG